MGSKVTCCKCGGRFDERALKGSWLDRHCPLCGKRLTEGMYDAAARDLAAHGGAPDELEELAVSRYYTSEWFRLACAARGSEAHDKGLFGLHVGYGAKGRLQLVPADDDRSPEGGWGRSAEYLVFDAIRAEVARKRSPLAGAFLVPSLVFPWLPGQKPRQWGARHRAEVDCVLLCETCAVVVEVKRRTHHVRASADCRHVRERTDAGRPRSASDVIEQIENCAAAFEERQRLYPGDRIFKLLVYVDPLSFECSARTFRDGWLVGSLNGRAGAGGADGASFIPALRELGELPPVADGRAVRELALHLLGEFGNTREPRQGRIVRGQAPDAGRRLRQTDAMLAAVEKLARDPRSPLHGARLLRYPACEVQVGKRGKDPRTKQVRASGLLLTRTHAVFIDARAWPVHVNTHVPFATVYVGDPKQGASRIDDSIRHDWDLREIRYENRSGSLTLLTYLAKCIDDLVAYQERNRVCTCNVFVNPRSFHSDCDDFRSRTFIGHWTRNGGNVGPALERLALSAEPVMTQAELDAFADGIAGIGTQP